MAMKMLPHNTFVFAFSLHLSDAQTSPQIELYDLERLLHLTSIPFLLPVADKVFQPGLAERSGNWCGKSARFHPETHEGSASGWAWEGKAKGITERWPRRVCGRGGCLSIARSKLHRREVWSCEHSMSTSPITNCSKVMLPSLVADLQKIRGAGKTKGKGANLPSSPFCNNSSPGSAGLKQPAS